MAGEFSCPCTPPSPCPCPCPCASDDDDDDNNDRDDDDDDCDEEEEEGGCVAAVVAVDLIARLLLSSSSLNPNPNPNPDPDPDPDPNPFPPISTPPPPPIPPIGLMSEFDLLDIRGLMVERRESHFGIDGGLRSVPVRMKKGTDSEGGMALVLDAERGFTPVDPALLEPLPIPFSNPFTNRPSGLEPEPGLGPASVRLLPSPNPVFVPVPAPAPVPVPSPVPGPVDTPISRRMDCFVQCTNCITVFSCS